jgi:fido (protein-threonine AMPylation protein)
LLLPSWVRKRETLKERSKEYTVFMERLKRQHAIETGIVERLYDLSESITETFIKEGFVESYLQHGDTNIPSGQLMAFLNDNFEALDFVFDLVKNNRSLTVGFIKELHHLITRHQDTAEGRDQFGNRLQIPLLKGAFKERENNPTRGDGTRFLYCPPVHVAAEMERLVSIVSELEERQVKPLLIATWLHHAFVTIHPFQDGNGRVARMLASLVLIKHNLFPLTVKRNEKKRYIDALTLADEDEPQGLVDYFGEMQKRNIEMVLNAKFEIEISKTSLNEMVEIFSRKLKTEVGKRKKEKNRFKLIERNRDAFFKYCHRILKTIKQELENKISTDAQFQIDEWRQDLVNKIFRYRDITNQYAVKHGYYFNDDLPGGGFIFKVQLSEFGRYDLIITLHHFGYDDSVFAVGSILMHSESNNSQETPKINPLSLKPFTISLDNDIATFDNLYEDLQSYLQNLLTIALAEITSELQ